MDRFGGEGRATIASAISTTAIVPDASSSAPLKMESPFASGLPTPT
jgi:hypothetical protein